MKEKRKDDEGRKDLKMNSWSSGGQRIGMTDCIIITDKIIITDGSIITDGIITTYTILCC